MTVSTGWAQKPMRSPRARKDGNHNEIVATFLATGCSVAETIATGIPGFPDLVVGCIGTDHLVEDKNRKTRYGRAGLNANQRKFADSWRGGKVEEVGTPDDVIALVQKWRKQG